MKVLAINGSARKDGNTAILTNTVFEELHKAGIETEMVQLSGKTIEPCKACFGCGGQQNCTQQNDLFREIFEKVNRWMALSLALRFIPPTSRQICRLFWNGLRW